MSGAEATAAAIARAIRASGVLIRLEPEEFQRILERQQEPLVVQSTTGFFSTKFQYLTSYKGLAFYTQAKFPLNLPSACEMVTAGRIWIP